MRQSPGRRQVNAVPSQSPPQSPAMRPTPAPNAKGQQAALLRRVDADSRRQLDATFDEMDVDRDGHVSTGEFVRFLELHPRGWPLADLLDGQTKDIRDQMIAYWFRKLDCQSEGFFTKDELAAFFAAMQLTSFKEAFLADFLLNLFDRDMDQKLSRVEMKRMLRVMLGKEPQSETVEQLCGRSGFVNRDDLVKLLHEVHCELGSIETSSRATVGASAVDALVVVGAIGAVAALAYAVSRRWSK